MILTRKASIETTALVFLLILLSPSVRAWDPVRYPVSVKVVCYDQNNATPDASMTYSIVSNFTDPTGRPLVSIPEQGVLPGPQPIRVTGITLPAGSYTLQYAVLSSDGLWAWQGSQQFTVSNAGSNEVGISNANAQQIRLAPPRIAPGRAPVMPAPDLPRQRAQELFQGPRELPDLPRR